MKHSRLSLCLALALAAVPFVHAADAPPAAKPALGTFGVDLGTRDLEVKPGDDFNRYASGQWLDSYQLKDYETNYGSFNMLRDQSEAQVRAIIQELQARRDLAPGSDAQKVRDYYASYMDRDARDAAGLEPLLPVLQRIAAIDSKGDLLAAFGNADLDGSTAPVRFGVSVDRKDPDQYLVSMGVGGLGLPDRDYYLNQDARFVKIRAAYVEHIQRMLGFAGLEDGKARAEAILALETELAKPMWERAQLRERDKTYNVVSFAELSGQYPGYDFAAQAKS